MYNFDYVWTTLGIYKTGWLKRQILAFIVIDNVMLFWKEKINYMFNVSIIYLPPVTMHVNFISPPSSYGPALLGVSFPLSSIIVGFCGGTEKKNTLV